MQRNSLLAANNLVRKACSYLSHLAYMGGFGNPRIPGEAFTIEAVERKKEDTGGQKEQWFTDRSMVLVADAWPETRKVCDIGIRAIDMRTDVCLHLCSSHLESNGASNPRLITRFCTCADAAH